MCKVRSFTSSQVILVDERSKPACEISRWLFTLKEYSFNGNLCKDRYLQHYRIKFKEFLSMLISPTFRPKDSEFNAEIMYLVDFCATEK